MTTDDQGGGSTWVVSGTKHKHPDRLDAWGKDLKAEVEKSIVAHASQRKLRIYRQVSEADINMVRDVLAPILAGVAALLLGIFFRVAQGQEQDPDATRGIVFSVVSGMLFGYAGWLIGRAGGIYSQTLRPVPSTVIKQHWVQIVVAVLALAVVVLPVVPPGPPWVTEVVLGILAPWDMVASRLPAVLYVLGSVIILAAGILLGVTAGFVSSQWLSFSKTSRIRRFLLKHPQVRLVCSVLQWEVDLANLSVPSKKENSLANKIEAFVVMIGLFLAGVFVLQYLTLDNVWPMAASLILVTLAFWIPQTVMGRSDSVTGALSAQEPAEILADLESDPAGSGVK